MHLPVYNLWFPDQSQINYSSDFKLQTKQSKPKSHKQTTI